MDNREYTISEISEISGYPAQTIQYFIEEHLLSKPVTRGYYTLYGQRFMNRLTLIKRMQENQLGVNEIRQRVTNLSDDQVNDLLALNNETFSEHYPPANEISPPSPEEGQHTQKDNSESIPEPQASLYANRWQRVEIMPGIELNIKESLLQTHQENLKDAIVEFINVFNNRNQD